MVQISTSEFQTLLVRFYDVVGLNHTKREENCSKLKNILTDNQTPLIREGKGQVMKKISQATDCSLTSGSEGELPSKYNESSASQLYFTFCPNNNHNQEKFSQQIINFRYRTHSLFKTVLYSLAFNHIQLQAMTHSRSVRIAHLFNQNRAIVRSLSSAVRSAKKREQGKGKQALENSLQTLQSYLREVDPSKCQHFIYNLRNLINNLSDELSREICLQIVHHSSSHMNSPQAIDNGVKEDHNNKIDFCNVNEEDDSYILEQLACYLKVRIKLKIQKEKISWGNKNSKICFAISQSPASFEFCLKQIIYYKQRQTGKSQMGQILKNSSANNQFAEI